MGAAHGHRTGCAAYIGDILESLRAALVAAAAGDHALAATLCGNVDALADQSGFVPVPPLREKIAVLRTAVREALAEKAWDTAVADGCGTSLVNMMARAARL